MPSTKQIKENKMDKLDQIMTNFIRNFRNVYRETKKQGFLGILNLFWKDLFAGRTTFQWVYLLLLSSVPFFLEWTNRTGVHDWLGLFASWTGIVCVILVAGLRPTSLVFISGGTKVSIFKGCTGRTRSTVLWAGTNGARLSKRRWLSCQK